MFRLTILLSFASSFFAWNCCVAFQANLLSDSYGIAAGHYDRAEYEQAVEKFREVIQQHPSTRQAAISYFFLGESFTQLGDYQSAVPAYRIFLERLPQDNYSKRAKFRLAECAYRLDWENQAAQLLELFISEFPEDALNEYTLTYLGEIRLQRNEPQLALRVFETALAKYPDSINMLRNRFGLAKALKELNRDKEATRFFDLIAENPSDQLAGLARMEIGTIELRTGDFESARSSLKQATQWMQGHPRLPEAQYWLAKTEVALGNYTAAFEIYLKAIDGIIDQDLKIAVLFDGAVAASKCDEYETALSWINRLRKTWPDSTWADDALQLKIELLYQQRRFDQALVAIDKFQKEFPRNKLLPVIFEYRGRIFYDRAEHDQTVDTFTDLIRTYAKNKNYIERVDVWKYFKGLGQLGLGKYQGASETLASMEMQKKEDEFKAAVLLAEASCAVGMQMPGRAIAFFEQYLATGVKGSSADRARSDLILAYAESGQWEKAKESLFEFATSHFRNEVLLQTKTMVAEMALESKRYSLAETYFRELANEKNPREYVVRGLSGVAWVRMTQGDEQSSVKVFERLIEEFSETKFAAEAAMACGKYFEQRENYEKAIEMYQFVRDRYQDSNVSDLADIRISYCLVRTGDESNRLKAESQLLAYLNTNSLFLDEAQYQLAWIYLDSEREIDAMKLFEEILEDQDSVYFADAAYRVSRFHIDNDRVDEAKVLLNQLEKFDIPSELYPRYQFMRGQLAAREDRWSDTSQLMEQVLAESDDELLRKKARYWLAESQFQLKNYEQSGAEFARLLESPDSISDQRIGWSKLRRAQCFAFSERWTEALEASQTALKEHPEFDGQYEFHFVAGRAHAAQGRLVDARDSYKKVIESEKGRSTKTAAMAQWRIGETFFHQEEFERAIEAYYRVDSLYSYKKWRAAALIEAGKCQEHLGNWNHAVKLYQQLIDKFPGSEFRVAAEQRLNLATRQANRLETSSKK